MLKRFVIFLFLFLLCREGAAQPPDDEYFPYAVREERTPLLETDSTLFYRAVQSPGDLYADVADFNLPQVAVARRGQDYRLERITAEGVEISYRYTAALRLLGAEEAGGAGIASLPDAAGLTGGVRSFRFPDAVRLLPYYASVNLSGRNYLTGAKFSAAGRLGRGWSGAVAAEARTGRDLYTDGVFTNALTLSGRLTRTFADGHSLTLVLVVPSSVRGMRMASVEEAFVLTGDRLYNPSWGFQDGKIRNSRVRRETVPLAVLSYRVPLSPSTSLAAVFGAEAGTRKYSSLGWYDARTPLPDNYRYLPSYTGDRMTGDAWRARDPRYTQIRWDDLVAVNRMAGGQAVYALEDRVGRICNLSAGVSFTTVVDDRLTLRYGLTYRMLTTRNYKQMRDLLGARHIVDIDQYLVDDDTFGNLLQNDLRRPDRAIRAGDRFGYDYTLCVRDAAIRLRAEYRSDRLRADVDLMLGDAAIRRRGHYEKELFPGDASYGDSRRLKFTPYTVKALLGWSFTPRSYLQFSALAAAAVPDASDLFYQSQYNNRTVDDPAVERLFAAEAVWRLTGPRIEVQLTAFATASFGAAQIRNYYDDLAGVFCDSYASGIATAAYGVEAAAQIRLSYRWSLSLAASAGRYEYIRNPRVTVLSDADNTAVDTRAESYMGGCSVGGAPQLTGCIGVGYFGPKGWGFRVSAGYAGSRFAAPSLVRRTARIARQGGVSQEAFDAFTEQERLGDAFTLDASLFKSFRFGRNRMTAALMLRNLLGDSDTVYDAYESLRVRRIPSGAATLWEPQATRYTYAYPRSFYLTVSYKF